ncbi:substrate-binding domain-containing protein [Oceanobacillus iheyensis]|uniref:substrate-binding domain-containing protein n=1 Tax=Oceanobacillus iheyensis TaxID=182710 RepID=UPI00362B700F
MTKRITISDVAIHAGVSKSTVSQYLNGRYDYMGQKTKEKIESAIKELKYSPNMVARSLKQKSSTTIGVIVANILHVFSTQVIRAIEDFCHEKGFHVIVCNADDNPDKEKTYIDMLRAKQVDGIIAFPTGDNVVLYQGLLEEQYPLVFMDRLVDGLDIPTVLLDNDKAATLAVDLLKDYQRPAIVTPPLKENLTPRMERLIGFKNELAKHGKSLPDEYIACGEISEIQKKLTELFQLTKAPDAIFAINDRVLHEVLTFMNHQHIRIPDDVALVNVDDVSFAEFYQPALTTISQPAFEMGKKAAELLFTQIKNPQDRSTMETFRFEPMVNRRKSC